MLVNFHTFRECAKELIERDTPGFAIGGLSGGEEKDQFWRMVAASTEVYISFLKTFSLDILPYKGKNAH